MTAEGGRCGGSLRQYGRIGRILRWLYRARAFALAFGFRDICWGFIYVAALLEIWSVLPAPDPNVVPSRFMVYSLGISTADAEALERGLQAGDATHGSA